MVKRSPVRKKARFLVSNLQYGCWRDFREGKNPDIVDNVTQLDVKR